LESRGAGAFGVFHAPLPVDRVPEQQIPQLTVTLFVFRGFLLPSLSTLISLLFLPLLLSLMSCLCGKP
jgi:hypothetical protein